MVETSGYVSNLVSEGQINLYIMNPETNNIHAVILTKLLQISLDKHCLPNTWLTSELIPVPKSNFPNVKNDRCLVALTAIVIKCFARIVLTEHILGITPHMDKLQLAYSEGERC